MDPPPQVLAVIVNGVLTCIGQQSPGSSMDLPQANRRNALPATKYSRPRLVHEPLIQPPFPPSNTTPRLPLFDQTAFVSDQNILDRKDKQDGKGQILVKKDELEEVVELKTEIELLSYKPITPSSSTGNSRGIGPPSSTPGTQSEIQKLRKELVKCREKISRLEGNNETRASSVKIEPISGTHPSIRIVELRLEHELETLKGSYKTLQEEHDGQTALVQEQMNKIASLERHLDTYIELIDRYKADASESTSGATTQAPKAKRPATPLQPDTTKRSKSAHAPIDLSDNPQVIPKPKNFLPTNRKFECLISGSGNDSPEYMSSTQLHQAISKAVISQMKEWESRNRSSTAWKWRKLSKTGACIQTAVVNKKSGQSQRWTEFDRACAKCTESRQPCMKVHKKAN